MVAGDTNIAYMSATCTLRIPLLCRGIADRRVGLLRRNRVRSGAQLKTAPGRRLSTSDTPGPHPTPCPAKTQGGEALTSISGSKASVCANVPTSLYLYYDNCNVLLYVGVTNRGARRNWEHNADKAWWPHVSRQEIRHLPSREEALRLEREIIAERRPPFNRQHNPGHEELAEFYFAYADPPDTGDESTWFSTISTDCDIAAMRDSVARGWREKFGMEIAQCLCGNNADGPEGFCGDSACRLQAATLAHAMLLSFDEIVREVLPIPRLRSVSADAPY